jgi:signal transduction histidine kinase
MKTRIGLFAAALVSAVAFSAPASAAPAARQVLVLQSFDRRSLTVDSFTADLRVDLDHGGATPVNIVQVVVSPMGVVGAPDQAVLDYIQSIYANGPKPDLVMSVAGPAAVFARKYRQQIFPQAPMLFAAVDQRFLGAAPLADNETATAVANDYSRLVEDILHVLPDTRRVFIVMGSGDIGRFWRRELESDFRRFEERVAFTWSNDLSLPEILRLCADLPDHSAIFYLTFGADARGGAYSDDHVLGQLHATANAPVFSVQRPMLGHGIVGGSLVSIAELARNTADVAIRILNGTPASAIRIPPQGPGLPTFDWRELRRWKIAESRLPPASEVLFREPRLWDRYRLPIISGLGVLAVQSFLIGGLLYQRRARQRAELESRRNLSLAADASRRQVMSTLTSSIAHDISQPLNAMALNAHALQTLVAADRASPEALEEILSDIQTQTSRAAQIFNRHQTMLKSRRLEMRPIDIHTVINESVALVAHDMRDKRIDAEIHLPPYACVVAGDPVLLQQVFVNLLVNAMDAVAALPPARRSIAIRGEEQGGTIRISVEDTGNGLPPDLDNLFAPFATTKSDGVGIGLTIARTIVDAHQGTIEGHNRPDGGASFTISLPHQYDQSLLSAPSGAA